MPRRSSLLGLLTAAALLAGQVAGLAHLLVVEHQRCPEHGELVHARARQAHATARAPVAVVTRQADEERDGDRHEHCLALADGARAGLAAPDAAGDRLPDARAAIAVRDGAPTRAATLLRLAPKTSPPGVG